MNMSTGCRMFTTNDSFPKLMQCLSSGIKSFGNISVSKADLIRQWATLMLLSLSTPAPNRLTNNPAEPHALPSNRMWSSKDWDCWSVSSQDVAEQCSHAALKHFIISSHADLYGRLGINGRSMINANLEIPTSCLELCQNLMSIHLEHQSQNYLLYEKHNGLSGCNVHPQYRHTLQWRFCEFDLRGCRNISARVASSTILLCRSQTGSLKAGLLYAPSHCATVAETYIHRTQGHTNSWTETPF